MAKVSLDQLKTKFESGDRPTAADYINLIDTLSESKALGSEGNNEASGSTVSGIENPTTIDTFSATDWRMVKYTVSISNMSSGVNKTYTTELTILIDNDNVNVSQYGMIDSNGDIGTVDVSKNAGQILLRVIPHSALMPVTARFYRTGLKA